MADAITGNYLGRHRSNEEPTINIQITGFTELYHEPDDAINTYIVDATINGRPVRDMLLKYIKRENNGTMITLKMIYNDKLYVLERVNGGRKRRPTKRRIIRKKRTIKRRT